MPFPIPRSIVVCCILVCLGLCMAFVPIWTGQTDRIWFGCMGSLPTLRLGLQFPTPSGGRDPTPPPPTPTLPPPTYHLLSPMAGWDTPCCCCLPHTHTFLYIHLHYLFPLPTPTLRYLFLLTKHTGTSPLYTATLCLCYLHMSAYFCILPEHLVWFLLLPTLLYLTTYHYPPLYLYLPSLTSYCLMPWFCFRISFILLCIFAFLHFCALFAFCCMCAAFS